MQYLGFIDLRLRWPLYTKMGLHKLVKRPDFPTPLFVIDAGKTRVWDERDIAIYETAHPELTDAEKKRRKAAAYGRIFKQAAGIN